MSTAALKDAAYWCTAVCGLLPLLLLLLLLLQMCNHIVREMR
jgi:hypothetical protein